jgi:hypothetical protein
MSISNFVCREGVPVQPQYAMVQVGYQWVPVQTGFYVDALGAKGIIHYVKHASRLVRVGIWGGNTALIKQADRVKRLMDELVKNSDKWQKDGNYSVRLEEMILQARVWDNMYASFRQVPLPYPGVPFTDQAPAAGAAPIPAAVPPPPPPEQPTGYAPHKEQPPVFFEVVKPHPQVPQAHHPVAPSVSHPPQSMWDQIPSPSVPDHVEPPPHPSPPPPGHSHDWSLPHSHPAVAPVAPSQPHHSLVHVSPIHPSQIHPAVSPSHVPGLFHIPSFASLHPHPAAMPPPPPHPTVAGPWKLHGEEWVHTTGKYQSQQLTYPEMTVPLHLRH